MDRTPVHSSNLRSVGYDATSATLEIEFDSGLYQYYGIPKQIYEGLMSAFSKGSYHHRFIKTRYRYRQIY